MRREGGPLIGLGHGLALVLTAAMGALFLLVYFERISLEETGIPYLELILAAVSLLVALYFLGRLLTLSRARPRIMSMGSIGPIWVAPEAVRDFILKVLEEELDIRDARVSLRPRGEGIGVEVQTSLPLEVNIAELGERIQERVRTRVEERVGVTVEQVEVFARSIRSAPAPAPPTRPAEAHHDERAAQLEGERDRVD